MKIKCFRECNINGTLVKPGVRDYAEINHKDRLTAAQLTILQKGGAIAFNEIVEPVTFEQYLEEKKAADKIEREKAIKEAISPEKQEKNRKAALEQLAKQREIARKKKEERDAGRDDAPSGAAKQNKNRNSGGGKLSDKGKD
jgi:hypothetical protein